MQKKKVSLLVDVGNSQIMSGLYFDGKIIKVSRIETNDYKKIIDLYKNSDYQKIFVSSVVPKLDSKLKKLFAKPIKFITSKNIPALKIDLKRSSQVGSDRIISALAAYKTYKKDCLIIDSGTAVTFCRVSKDGVYQGGAIFPGMKIASQALNDYTAKIPLIWVAPQKNLIGKDTIEAVKAGLYHGYIHLINGMINEHRKKNKNIFAIGTGKGLEILTNKLQLDAYAPDLILQGLAICADFVK